MSTQYTVSEIGLTRRIGTSRTGLREWRVKHLVQGVDWDTEGRNVMLTADAASKMTAAMTEIDKKTAPGAAETPEPPDIQLDGPEVILDSSPRSEESIFAPSAEKNGGGETALPMRDAGEARAPTTPAAIEVVVATSDPAGSIATTTRQSPEIIPMLVTRCAFKNTRLVEAQRLDGGLPVLVRVADATKFIPRMEIPVRQERDALGGDSHWVLAHANPRWRGKW